MYLTYLTRTLKLRHRMVDKLCELPVIPFLTVIETRSEIVLVIVTWAHFIGITSKQMIMIIGNIKAKTIYMYSETKQGPWRPAPQSTCHFLNWNRSVLHFFIFKFTVVRIDMKNFRETMSKRQISIDENLYLANINMILSSMPFY